VADTADGALPALTIDLGTVRPLAGVRCVPLRPDPDAPGIHLARVELSSDGVRWEPAPAAFEPDSLETLFARPADVRFYEARFPARAARFVRLVNPEIAFLRGRWELAEVEVLEEVRP
jgi:hypothetical protein